MPSRQGLSGTENQQEHDHSNDRDRINACMIRPSSTLLLILFATSIPHRWQRDISHLGDLCCPSGQYARGSADLKFARPAVQELEDLLEALQVAGRDLTGEDGDHGQAEEVEGLRAG
jgi:hypothetical protein